MRSIIVFCTAMLMVAAVQGHHSFAVFDFDTRIPFEGTVENLNFRNPHISMTLRVVDENGEEKIIDFIEGAPANMLARSGLRRGMIESGEKITAIGSPLIEDPDKYFLRKIILEDGREFE